MTANSQLRRNNAPQIMNNAAPQAENRRALTILGTSALFGYAAYSITLAVGHDGFLAQQTALGIGGGVGALLRLLRNG